MVSRSLFLRRGVLRLYSLVILVSSSFHVAKCSISLATRTVGTRVFCWLCADFPCHRPVHVFISWENIPILLEAITMISDSSGLCTLNSGKIMGASILDINKLN